MVQAGKITVRAPAHLHAGNVDLNGGLGRLYGTVGFTIEEPKLEIEVEKGRGLTSNDRDASEFAKKFIERFKLSGVHIKLKRKIPAYVGLGYHTTLALSVGLAMSEVYCLGLSMEEIALTMRRGLLTALGLYACKAGGMVVDGGFRKGELDKMVPPLIFRSDIPSDWRFVVAIPEKPKEKIVGLRGKEDAILGKVGMSGETSSYLSRLVLLKLIPSILEEDLEEFGTALTEFNRRLGTVWKKHQKGIYCDPIVEKGIEILEENAFCACQSSWGPTFYGIMDEERKAKKIASELKKFLDENGGGEVFFTKGRNRGLEVIVHGKSHRD